VTGFAAVLALFGVVLLVAAGFYAAGQLLAVSRASAS